MKVVENRNIKGLFMLIFLTFLPPIIKTYAENIIVWFFLSTTGRMTFRSMQFNY
jgi:hypothetical protein